MGFAETNSSRMSFGLAAAPAPWAPPAAASSGPRRRRTTRAERHVQEPGTGHLDPREPRGRRRRRPRRCAAMASAISRGGRRAAFASAIATGLARSPISAEAGAARGTTRGGLPHHGAGRRGDGGADLMREGGRPSRRASLPSAGPRTPALALAGCGGGRTARHRRGRPHGADRARSTTARRLTATTDLDCTGRGGACDRVIALLPRLGPEPGEVCTQIYGGPERLVVTGTVDGTGPSRSRSPAPTAARSPATTCCHRRG